jgi:hypothetical protein
MADFVPTNEGDLRKWLTTIKTETPKVVTDLEITPTRMTQITAWCDTATGAMDAAESATRALRAANKAKKNQVDTSVAGLRLEVGKWKVADGMTDAIAAQLQINGTYTPFDPESYKPKLTADVFSGYVRFKFKKNGAQGMIFYSRIKGTMGWKFVSRDTNSPYDDHTPLAVPGVAEVREYQAFGLWGDEQIGQASDIVTVTFAG